MLKEATPLVHPRLLAALAGAGHKALVLLADANFATTTHVNPRAEVVYVGWRVGAPSVPDLLSALAQSVAIESSWVMAPPADFDRTGSVIQQVTSQLGCSPGELTRSEFYERTRGADLALAVVTGENRRFGNLLLGLGAVL